MLERAAASALSPGRAGRSAPPDAGAADEDDAGGGSHQERVEHGLLRAQVPRLATVDPGGFDSLSQRACPFEQTLKHGWREPEGAVADPGERVFEPVHVVFDPDEADHPAVALEGVQRSEEGRHDFGGGAGALELEESIVEDREVLACVLEVDADELCGDLELHQRSGGRPPGLTVR